MTTTRSVDGFPQITVEYQAGEAKTYWTQKGHRDMAMPLDYGYFNGTINPDDGMSCDVFVGTAFEQGKPALCGVFNKFKPTTANGLQFDERKWFVNCTEEELKKLHIWWISEHDLFITDQWRVKSHSTLSVEIENMNAGSFKQ